MNINIYCYENLPAWVDKDDLSNNGSGKENAQYLIVEEGPYIQVFSDAMEPEDARFSRDLNWVKTEILKAYELGKLAHVSDWHK